MDLCAALVVMMRIVLRVSTVSGSMYLQLNSKIKINIFFAGIFQLCKTSAKMCAEGRVCSTQIVEKMDQSATGVQEALSIDNAQNKYIFFVICIQSQS